MSECHVPSVEGSLVVFDFDHTMIGCNSDTWVVEQLSKRKEVILGKLSEAGKRNAWTAGMDQAMAALHEEGVSVESIRECMEAISIDEGIKKAVRRVSSRGGDVRVLSDANTLFIEWIIHSNGLGPSVSKILSNPAHVEASGKLRVRPFHTDPHPPTSTSPPNLCKGRVMEDWLSEKQWTRVVYCGDGGGDFEGCLRVPSGGVIMARDGWTLHKKLLQAVEAGDPPRAPIQAWTDQHDLGTQLDALL
uniref:Phosphoserine phosphatase n=1 Tax=Hemiselmis tepida TaxID=464990 RepID=A0A7S0VT75_9CRYP|mmetsp:Transcript_25647/g.65212  ORF Transcript_25647/g.65212 Transcript_25647/m.65212 type:complete len:247 (+) Transcript_25647:252-992(+)